MCNKDRYREEGNTEPVLKMHTANNQNILCTIRRSVENSEQIILKHIGGAIAF